MLAMPGYTYNNSKHSSTKNSPFYANHSFEPWMNWPTAIQFKHPASELFGHYINEVHRKPRERPEESVHRMKKYHNKKRKSIEPFKQGELVMLDGRNIWAKHRCKKLEDTMLGPFEVVSVGSNLMYPTLQQPHAWKIHSVFNIDLFEQ